MNNYFANITALLNILAANGVPAQLFECYEGFQLRFPWYSRGDVACHRGTFGQLESYRFPWDDGDVTRDTPDGMAQRITEFYQSRH